MASRRSAPIVAWTDTRGRAARPLSRRPCTGSCAAQARGLPADEATRLPGPADALQETQDFCLCHKRHKTLITLCLCRVHAPADAPAACRTRPSRCRRCPRGPRRSNRPGPGPPGGCRLSPARPGASGPPPVGGCALRVVLDVCSPVSRAGGVTWRSLRGINAERCWGHSLTEMLPAAEAHHKGQSTAKPHTIIRAIKLRNSNAIQLL